MTKDKAARDHRPPDGLTLESAIGVRVRELRKLNGWSQDELARRLRVEGFSAWSRSVVAAFEKGGKRILLEDVIALSIVFQRRLVDFIPVVNALKVGDRWEDPEAIANALEGDEPPRERATRRLTPEEMSEYHRLFERWRRRGVWAFDDPAIGAQVEADAGGELEGRISRRLAVSPMVVALAARNLWGHSASEERELRAKERPNAKQHISRELIAEIDEALGSRGRKGE